jgi:uncharacterized protein YggE
MSGNVTVSVRGVLVGALVAMGLVVAYLLGSGGGGGTPAQAADGAGGTGGASSTNDGTRPRVLTMTGTGEATAVPDELSFGLGVTVTRTDLGDALDAASATMKRVLATLTEYDVARSDLQTTGLSMTPVYDYHPYDPPTIRGYRVTQRASVLVKDLAQGGAAVAAAVAAGGSDVRVSNLRLLVADPDAATARARQAAVAEAQARAQQYADASGQSLGDVLTLREVHVRPLPTPTRLYRAQAADAVAGKAVPVRAGRERTAVTVRMVWELA